LVWGGGSDLGVDFVIFGGVLGVDLEGKKITQGDSFGLACGDLVVVANSERKKFPRQRKQCCRVIG
jgi:hypothetical protein